MLKIENTETYGWEAAIRGMRNPKNSWARMDSAFEPLDLGENDLQLAYQLAGAGPVHGKFLRMITVTADITAPMYWWAEFDTYKVGTARNSCSKMHKLLAKPFEMSDFSFDHLIYDSAAAGWVDMLNGLRNNYLESKDEAQKKRIWYTILQLLPESYNQRSTVQMNYSVLANMYEYRKGHRLDEWHTFCDWIKKLPYSDFITGNN